MRYVPCWVGRTETVGVLICGASMVLMAAGSAPAADDKLIEELKARLDRLEKQNEELRALMTDIGLAK